MCTNAPAILLIGNDPTEQHPLLAWQIRNNVRLHGARLVRRQFPADQAAAPGRQLHQIPRAQKEEWRRSLAGDDARSRLTATGEIARRGRRLRDKLRGEQNLVIIFGSEIRGEDISALVKFGSVIAGAKFICLGDYANSRGAADMGLYPDLLPGYHRVADAGKFHEEWGDIPRPRA